MHRGRSTPAASPAPPSRARRASTATGDEPRTRPRHRPGARRDDWRATIPGTRRGTPRPRARRRSPRSAPVGEVAGFAGELLDELDLGAYANARPDGIAHPLVRVALYLDHEPVEAALVG